MTNYKCEESVLCENFQAAICLHCNHRLCVRHIIEHEKIVLADIKKLSNLAEKTRQQIKDQSEENRIVYNNSLSVLNDWRTQQLEKIGQIYKEELLLIENEGDALEDYHQDLLKQLEHDARQPLERVQKQQNTNTKILNQIRQTNEQIQKEFVDLKWDFLTPSLTNTEYIPSDLPSIQLDKIFSDIKSII